MRHRRRRKTVVIVVGCLIVGLFAAWAFVAATPRHLVGSRCSCRLSPVFSEIHTGQLFISPSVLPDTTIRLFKKTTDQPQLLYSGSVALEGDEVQIQYTTRRPYGVILSVDGRGVVSQHFPDSDTNNTRIETGTHVLPFAFELDDAPGYEMFFFLSSDTPISLAAIIKKSARIKSIQESIVVPDNIHLEKVVLHKLPRPIVSPRDPGSNLRE